MKIAAVFMDLSKAFDCLPHGLLIAKLHAYCLSTAACHLMFSYLKGRRQRVKISNSRSSWKLLTKDVPQGSILSPFLFNVFMNDLFLFIQNCKLYNYADDNSMIYSSPDINAILTNLKHDCNNAIKWFGDNSMKANPDKFQFMLLSSDPLEQQKIEIENDMTFLSDDRLQFNDHISAMCCRAARQLNALARIHSKNKCSEFEHINCNRFWTLWIRFTTSVQNTCSNFDVGVQYMNRLIIISVSVQQHGKFHVFVFGTLVFRTAQQCSCFVYMCSVFERMSPLCEHMCAVLERMC